MAVLGRGFLSLRFHLSGSWEAVLVAGEGLHSWLALSGVGQVRKSSRDVLRRGRVELPFDGRGLQSVLLPLLWDKSLGFKRVHSPEMVAQESTLPRNKVPLALPGGVSSVRCPRVREKEEEGDGEGVSYGSESHDSVVVYTLFCSKRSGRPTGLNKWSVPRHRVTRKGSRARR